MQVEFESYLNNNFSYLFKEPSIICCSGGIDSIVLFHLMLSVSKNFVVAHCNFNLRDESDLDENFVRNICEKNSITFYSKSFNTKKIKEKSNKSVQMIARELRYNFFDDLSNKLSINHILTAHHLNDSLETFLINLSRGSGLDGLIGIPKENNKIKRPLISFEKTELIAYAKTNKLKWREDLSNKSNSYLRNKIRNKIIPELFKLDGNFLKNFKKSISYLGVSNAMIYQKINQLKSDLLIQKDDEIRIKVFDLDKINKKAFLYYFLRDFGFNDWDKILNLQYSESGKKILSKTHILVKSKNELVLKPIQIIKKISKTITDIIKPINFNNGNCLKFTIATEIEKYDNNIITIDSEKLKLPLLLRNFKNGDIFYPFGMNGSKKVGKYLKDNKINQIYKSSAIVLVNADNKIIWVVGMRLDSRFSITKKTSKFLNIEYSNKDLS
tara:strand:- start:9940 stop:11262 length:1323 start_codon:yes stop_codon:yes gene_type:complete